MEETLLILEFPWKNQVVLLRLIEFDGSLDCVVLLRGSGNAISLISHLGPEGSPLLVPDELPDQILEDEQEFVGNRLRSWLESQGREHIRVFGP